MAIERARTHLRIFGREQDIIELGTSTATVALAAEALEVEPARIAKTLCFKAGEGAMLVVAAGDAKIDNQRFRAEFGQKAQMLSPAEVLAFTGHEVGGVCPFGLLHELPVYLDISMRRFATVFPACGSDNSAIELTWEELAVYASGKKWVDVCKGWREEAEAMP